jgi:DNA-binding transcriptional regulator YhcF (GntR family)
MIPVLTVGWHGLPAISERDSDVVSLIDEEELTLFTFDGLKRRLGLHPETLSRILSRLEEEGIVKKQSNGYAVTPKIAKLRLQEPRQEENYAPLLQTYLPSNMQVQQLVAGLTGKWFGLLRWFGLAEDSHGVTMKWVTEDGGMQINAKIQDSTLTIEAKFLHDNNLNRALSASYQLMSYISGILSSRHHVASHVGLFGDSNFFLMPA